jgi:hypothetical protein
MEQKIRGNIPHPVATPDKSSMEDHLSCLVVEFFSFRLTFHNVLKLFVVLWDNIRKNICFNLEGFCFECALEIDLFPSSDEEIVSPFPKDTYFLLRVGCHQFAILYQWCENHAVLSLLHPLNVCTFSLKLSQQILRWFKSETEEGFRSYTKH